MSGLTPAQLSALQGVLAQTPDAAIERLERSLEEEAGLAALKPVRDMVRSEAEDRRARAAVFAPLLPLCRATAGGPLSFPIAALAQLWRALKARKPGLVETATDFGRRVRPPEDAAQVLDALCREAAKGLREAAEPDFIAAAERLNAARPGGAAAFAGLLDITPIARDALGRLPGWLVHMTDDAAAAVRLAFRDATAVSEDAGCWLMEVLYVHLDDPSRILRLISAVMDHPGEGYVAASEMAGLVERVLDHIEARVAAVAALDPDAGRPAGALAGQAAAEAVAHITEFERAFELTPNGRFGQRVARQKRALAAAVEQRLKLAGNAVGQALPLKSRGRGAVRGLPNLGKDPEPRLVTRAIAFLAFMDATRSAAVAGGFGRPRAEAVETLSAMLDQYVEDLLEVLHGGDPELVPQARAYLDIAAEFLALVTDDRAAEVARRRAAAA
jgi:hypothetical protein